MNGELVDIRISEKDQQEAKKRIDFEEILERNKLTVGFLLAGLILIGLGILGLKVFNFENGPKVEILGSESGSSSVPPAGGTSADKDEKWVKITVEVAGEVIKPGVYQLPVESRINDLLTAAGGLSAEADREWVAKNVNLAQKLIDGAKIYVPGKTQNAIRDTQNENLKNSISEKININTASEAQLDTLWGIGPATAKKIIDGRPYQKPEQLLEKKILKSNVWEQIKDKISVF